MTEEVERTDAPSVGQASWQNIEPILKWVGVAYMFGFLIVMVYTYQLGIPTLQLIDPINIWIGAPLAILAFFVDKIYLAVKREVRILAQSLKNAASIAENLNRNSPNSDAFYNQINDILLSSIAQLAAPFGLSRPFERLLRWFFRDSSNRSKDASSDEPPVLPQTPEGTVPDQRHQRMLNKIEPFIRWILRVLAFNRFLSVIAFVIYISLACALYVEVFPHIPQTLGGGRPLAVEILVSPEVLPQGKEFEDWRTDSSPSQQETKASILVRVNLYFRNENELIVRKGTGPVIALSSHAIEGIVFPPR